MTIQHTPGPWSIDDGQIRNSEGDSLGSVPCTLGDETDAANGRLMAAAPELLEACSRVLAAMEWSVSADRMDNSEIAALMRTAITSAVGEAMTP